MSPDSKVFRDILRDLRNRGQLVSPRGQLVREVENFSYELPALVRFQSFECRKLNLSYIKRELLWYIKGDRFDTSICAHAKTWRDIVNADGSINSNYGQYIFGKTNQFDRVVETLSGDKDSRRASISILGSEHLLSDTKDVPCTYSLNFRIRSGKLNMSVHMRSQDAIYGMGNDAPAFSVIHEMVLNALKRKYPDLECGTYFHTADSFHVYERHFAMFDSITDDDSPSPYVPVECPKISGPDEVDFIRALDFSSVPEQYKFTRWLTT